MTTKKIYQIAIDGPSGRGEIHDCQVGRAELGIDYIDTGAMYRSFGTEDAAAGTADD